MALQQYSRNAEVALPLSFFTFHLNQEDRELVELLQDNPRLMYSSKTFASEFAALQFLSRLFLPASEVVDTVMIKTPPKKQ